MVGGDVSTVFIQEPDSDMVAAVTTQSFMLSRTLPVLVTAARRVLTALTKLPDMRPWNQDPQVLQPS